MDTANQLACYESKSPKRWARKRTNPFAWLALGAPLSVFVGCLVARVAFAKTGADFGMFISGIVSFWGSVIPLMSVSETRGRNKSVAKQLASWRELVPRELPYAPAWPLEDFLVIVPEQSLVVEEDGSSTLRFQSRSNRWQGDHWQGGELVEPSETEGLETSFKAGRDLGEIAAAWFDYQQAVATANGSRFELEFARQHSSAAEELRGVQLALTA